MADETNQARGLEFIQTLPDEQLRDLRRAAAQEMKRRGLKGEGKGKGGRKGRDDEDDDSED